MGDLGAGIFEGADGGMSAADPEERERAARAHAGSRCRRRRCRSRSAWSRPSGATHLLDFLDDAAAEGGRMIAQTHCRGISVLLSFEDEAALRPAARVARPACATPRPAAALCSRDAERRRPYVDAATRRELRRVARRRRAGPPARLRGHPRLRARPAAEPDGRRRRARTRCAPRRGDDRPRASIPTASSSSSSRACTRRTRTCCSRRCATRAR